MPDHRGRRENGHKAYLVGFLVNWLNEKYSGLFGGAGGGLDKLTKGLLLSENDMRFIFKEINGINYDEMMACYFAAAVEINREDQTARDIESIGLSTKSQSALSKELFEAKKRSGTLQTGMQSWKNRCREKGMPMQKQEKKSGTERNTESTIESLRQDCGEKERRHNKEIKELNAEIESLRSQLSRLEQVIEESADGGNEGIEEECEKHVDHEKRYYFVCDHAVTCKKLMDEFPNTKCSMDFEDTGGECGRFDAAVFIIPQVKHMNYYRYKNICKDNKIPVVHSNTTGIRTIKLLLVQQGFGR